MTDDLRLAPGEKRHIEDWLQTKWIGDPKCPVSGDTNWIIGDHIVTPMVQPKDGGLVVGGPSYPSVLVICAGCGYTINFNALVIGLRRGGEAKDGAA